MITELYRENGYITSGAYLPIASNQGFDPKNAIITLNIIEGTVEEIQVVGADRLQDYIRKRLKHDEDAVFNQEHLKEAMRFLQIDPLLKTVSIELLPGTKPNTSILKVNAQTQKPFRVSLGLNNHRSPAVGSLEREITLSHSDVLGFGDRMIVNYGNTDGSHMFAGEYTLPINTNNGTFAARYNFIDSNITEKPFNELDIEGDSSLLELTYRQPLIRRAKENSIEEFALGISASRYESENSIFGIPFPLSEGTDINGRSEATALRFFQDWLHSDRKQAISLHSQLSVGLDVFSPTLNPNPPDGNFVAWQLQGRWFRYLPHRLQLICRGQLNLADRPLLGIEQLSLGGNDSVRGYRQNAFLRDNGALGSCELGIPLYTSNKHALQLRPFVDFGTGWNNERIDPLAGPIETSRTLLSVGLGLTYQLKDNLFAQINWGIPLLSGAEGGSPDNNPVTFSLQWQN